MIIGQSYGGTVLPLVVGMASVAAVSLLIVPLDGTRLECIFMSSASMKNSSHEGLRRPGAIDRDAFEPAYSQLANILKAQIAAGAFRPGDQLPSEAQLCRTFGVSPMTVRRSINLLADQDVVSTAQGKGTFVRRVQFGAAAFDLRELQDLLRNDATTIKLLDARIVTANQRTAGKL